MELLTNIGIFSVIRTYAIIIFVISLCYSNHLSGVRRNSRFPSTGGNSSGRRQSTSSNSQQSRVSMSVNRRTDINRIRGQQSTGRRTQNSFLSTNQITDRNSLRSRRPTQRSFRRNSNSRRNNRNENGNPNSIQTNISIQRRPSNSLSNGSQLPRRRNTNSLPRSRRMRNRRLPSPSRRQRNGSTRSRPSKQQIVNNLANTGGRTGDIARGILLEEMQLKQLSAVYPGCTLDDFKFLNLSTIFREDFPGTRDAQIGSEFDYNPSSPRGPHTWNILWPGCNGILQSPININTSRVIYERPFQINYNLENLVISGDFLNNGHSCAFYPSRKLRAMYGVPHAEREMYILDEIHFHFGNDLQHGSEHSMNNLFFPVEIHLVHYNSRYENAKNASKYRDGLVALGVFMEVGFGPPTELDRFISTYVPRIAIPDNVGVPAILDINSILPYNRDLFTYYGSKTTPPCTHNIRWILMRTHKTITSQSHRLLYYLRNHENQRISRYGNFRPVQDSTCRMVEANFRNS